MKKSITIIAAVFAAFLCQGIASAQEIPAGYERVDSLVYKDAALLDASLEGVNVLSDLDVNQSEDVTNALGSHIEKNRKKLISGYRVRIFFDNGQEARSLALGILGRFKSQYPGVPVYMDYVNPYFKITVGDYRTRTDAVRMLNTIKGAYPTAFIVKENINYPVIDEGHSYIVVDTIKVLRKVPTVQNVKTE